MSGKKTYLGKIGEAAKTVAKGLSLSGKHLKKGFQTNEPLGIEHPDYFKQVSGPITIQYPQAKVPVPENGRYRLHMETDDCIGCDKCARICPVDCITIDTFRADGDLGRTSDGTVKRLHLPVFDIDMGKCMYCGLCTTVCPTECLTMTKVYDYSEYDRDNLVYHFGAYSPEEEEVIREETAAALAVKKAAKAQAAGAAGAKKKPVRRKPVARRQPLAEPVDAGGEETGVVGAREDAADEAASKKRARPVRKRKVEEDAGAAEHAGGVEAKPKAKKRARPVMKRKVEEGAGDAEQAEAAEEKPQAKKRARPVMKRKVEENAGDAEQGEVAEEKPQAKKRARPVMKRKVEEGAGDAEKAGEELGEDKPKPKKRPRPIMRRKPADPDKEDGKEGETE